MTDRQAILDEIIQFTTPPTIEEDEFTVNDYWERCPSPKPTRETIRGRLKHLVERGVLEPRKVLRNAKWTIAYRKVKQNDRDLAGCTG